MYRHVNSLIPIFLTIFLGACANHSHQADQHAEESHHHNEGEIILEPDEAERFGVEVTTIQPGAFSESLLVTGDIIPSTTDISVVSSPTQGIITFAPGINLGTHVTAGQPVANVSAANVSGGDPDRAARVALENAQRELDRVTPLLADGLVTIREYNDALAALESARAAYSPTAAHGSATAPRSGVITAINTANGEYVAAGQPIATVSGSGSLTLCALVPASQAPFLADVNNAVINSHDGQPINLADFGGRLISSSQSAAPTTPGYIPVYFTFSSEAPIVAGSATEVYLLGRERAGIISLPKDAIVEQMGRKFVFIRHGDHEYVKQPIVTAGTDGSNVEIVSGLEPGNVVVTRGATFVRLAEQATVVPEGHSHHH